MALSLGSLMGHCPLVKVFFSCGGKDGTYMIASSARRQLRMNNTILLLRIPGVGVLTHPKHPDTTFFTCASYSNAMLLP